MKTPQYLTIPTTPETWIPLQMSEDDFGLMMATIDLWKSRIVAASEGGTSKEESPKPENQPA